MRCALLLFVTTALASAARLPVAFEPNRGQDPGPAEFIAHTSGAALTLGAGRAEWISRQARVALVFAAARRGVHGQGEDALPGVVNYVEGNQPSRWLKDLPTYSRVRYAEMYPGVDVVYYVNDGRLEYDVVLGRGADPGRIRLRVEGAEGLRVDDAGDLVIATAGGELRQHRPLVYQDIAGQRSPVTASYKLHGREVSFALGRYDRSAALVIDPALTWASYLLPTGGLNAEATGLALDSFGNTYMTGTVLSPAGYWGCFADKLSSAGALLSATYISAAPPTNYTGYGDVWCNSIAVDPSGYMYIAGYTDSGYLYAVYNYLNYYAGYSYDAFIMKINSSANVQYSYYFGGSGGDAFNGVTLDSYGDAFLVGTTTSPDLPLFSNGALVANGAPTTTGPAQTSLAGNSNAFVVEMGRSGNIVYSSYLGGSGSDYGNAIAADGAGDAFVTGSTSSTNFPVTNLPFQSKLKGASNAFAAKIGQPNGSLIFSTYLGGSGTDDGNGIAVDQSGAAFITGDTSSTDFPVTPGAYQFTYAGGASDAFVTRLAGSGQSLLYSTYLGGGGVDIGYSVAFDQADDAYITGATTSINFPTTADAFQSSNQGHTNAFVAGLNPFGAGLRFSSYLGGSGKAGVTNGLTNSGDYGTALALNCAAGLVVAGVTTSTDFPATSGTVTPSYPGDAPDAFVAQIAAGGGYPEVSPGGIVNDASFSTGPVAPGSLVAIFGSDLAAYTQLFAGFPLTTSLAGATVNVNGVNAPMFYAASGQVNIQLPSQTGVGTAAAIVTDACGSSGSIAFSVAQTAPYIFENAAGQATAVLNQDYSVNGPANPTKVGSIVMVYLTGIGPVSIQPADGAAASLATLSPSTLVWSATIGGWNVPYSPYQFLGLAPGYVGLDQANLLVPAGLSSGAYPVVITVGGVPSNGPNIYVTN